MVTPSIAARAFNARWMASGISYLIWAMNARYALCARTSIRERGGGGGVWL